ncbi:MSHA pilin protein MshA [Candidatus Magnetomorum sp. HK-1]|nr:MSHA pilin protein MshA [Candidatus Magnetomorum sp. HK-1]
MNSKKRLNYRGFTIIEIMVLLVIIGILAYIIIPKFTSLQGDTRHKIVEGVLAELQARSNISYAKGGLTKIPVLDRVPDISDLNGVDNQFEIVDRPLPRREQYITLILPNGNIRVPVYYIPPRDELHPLGAGPASFFPYE